ncbi:MAG: hypothetical protein IIZ48_01335 [Erysipelotrichales bacterium]|nr:hypothetical protein [Erysipelotrichales bacterium]
MSEKKKKKRRAYLEDFAKDEKGKYTYTGKIYEYKGREELKKIHTLATFLTAVIAVSIILAGLLPAKGITDTWYVVLPYLGAFTTAAIFAWKYGRYRFNAKELREYVHEKTVKQFQIYTKIQFVFSLLTALGEVLYLLLNSAEGRMMESVTVVVCMGVSALAAYIWILLERELDWKVKEM